MKAILKKAQTLSDEFHVCLERMQSTYEIRLIMKAILKKAQTLSDEVHVCLERMQSTYENRSEQWKDSEKGEEYLDRIIALINLRKALEVYTINISALEI